MSTAGLKDRELQSYYETIFDLYTHPGWALLQQQLELMIESHDTVTGIETGKELMFRKGQLDQMLWLQSHKSTHEAAYNELLAQENEGMPEATPGGKATVVE